MTDPLPWEARLGRLDPESPGLLVDLRRCIGCHACSIACKTAHEVPLGSFRMRVRWLPRPGANTLAFVPLFDAAACDLGASARAHGLAPECVRACPTEALRYGDRADPADALVEAEAALDAIPFGGPAATHPDVRYAGLEPWIPRAVGRGVPLDPQDPDVIYEQPREAQ